MKSITQFNQEKDTKSLISSFTKLIGLGDLSKKVNFKRHSLVSLLMVITWMIKARFARKSLYRCQRAKNFTAKTGRNVLNDGRINWQKLVCLTAVKMNKLLEYDPTSLTMTVQAGMRLIDIEKFLADKPFSYMPAPAMHCASIGGNIDTDAGRIKSC